MESDIVIFKIITWAAISDNRHNATINVSLTLIKEKGQIKLHNLTSSSFCQKKNSCCIQLWLALLRGTRPFQNRRQTIKMYFFNERG